MNARPFLLALLVLVAGCGQKPQEEPPIRFSVPEAEIPPEGGAVDVMVFSGPEWRITATSGDWLTAKQKNTAYLTLIAPLNDSGRTRTGSVQVTCGAQSAELTVVQDYDADATVASKAEFIAHIAASCDFITKVTNSSFTDLDKGCTAYRITTTGPVNGTESPLALFLFVVDLSSGLSLAATCVDDNPANITLTDATKAQRQTIREQLAALQGKRPGLRVLGGVNGDFYLIDRNNLLHGVFHRNGVCVKDTFDGGAGCNVFALMQDGTARVLSQTQYPAAKNSIAEAVGGRQVVLRAGVTVSSDTKLDPRTVAGVSMDGKTVYILSVDGRRENWSVGASYPMLAAIMRAAGAYDAVNLDGGGSTTFVVHPDDNTSVSSFTTWNKPSDGSDRAVVNGLAIVRPR